MSPIIFWGDLLRSLRESNNLLQKEMALVLHVSRQTYSNLETGRARPSPEQLAILSYIYGVDLMDYIHHCLPQEYLDEQEAFRKYTKKKLTLEQDMEGISEMKHSPGTARPEGKKKRNTRTRPTVLHTYTGEEALAMLKKESSSLVAEPGSTYGKNTKEGSESGPNAEKPVPKKEKPGKENGSTP